MSDATKKSILWFVVSAIFLTIVAISRSSDNPIKVAVKDGTSVNKSTCINAFNSLKSAKFQKKMLDQQVLLSTAAGRGDEAAAAGVQVSELKVIIVIFEDLIKDPKLACHEYLKDEPTVTRKVI